MLNKKAETGSGRYLVWFLIIMAVIVGITGALRVQEAISSIPSWLWWVIAGFLVLSLLKGGKKR